MKDQIIHKSRAWGERHGMAKLTENDVLEIRSEYARGSKSMGKIAEDFEVSQSAISLIILRKNWTHI